MKLYYAKGRECYKSNDVAVSLSLDTVKKNKNYKVIETKGTEERLASCESHEAEIESIQSCYTHALRERENIYKIANIKHTQLKRKLIEALWVLSPSPSWLAIKPSHTHPLRLLRLKFIKCNKRL